MVASSEMCVCTSCWVCLVGGVCGCGRLCLFHNSYVEFDLGDKTVFFAMVQQLVLPRDISFHFLKNIPASPRLSSLPACLQGDVWICMELLDASMDKISKRVATLGQTIPEDILGKMSVAVINALHYLKEDLHIIHRGKLIRPLLSGSCNIFHLSFCPDVKPSNILVSRKCEFKLCDFGISGKLVDSLAKTMEVGCRPYMAVSGGGHVCVCTSLPFLCAA